MYILDHAVAPWFLEVTIDLSRDHEILYFLLPQNLPWHPATPPLKPPPPPAPPRKPCNGPYLAALAC